MFPQAILRNVSFHIFRYYFIHPKAREKVEKYEKLGKNFSNHIRRLEITTTYFVEFTLRLLWSFLRKLQLQSRSTKTLFKRKPLLHFVWFNCKSYISIVDCDRVIFIKQFLKNDDLSSYAILNALSSMPIGVINRRFWDNFSLATFQFIKKITANTKNFTHTPNHPYDPLSY